MQLLTGMYNARIDDKGRLSLPARLRTAIAAEQVVVLPGLDENHLMIMRPEYFEKDFSEPILSSPMAMLDKKKRILIRKLISPAIYVDIDSSGRINIPPQFRINLRRSWSEQGIRSSSGILMCSHQAMTVNR